MAIALMCGFMPAAVIAIPLNQMLRDPASADYRAAAGVVSSAATVHDALVGTGILGQYSGNVAAEAQAVLRALPPSIDEAIMVALRSAFGRSIPVTLTWIEDPKIAVRLWEQEQEDGVRLNILFMSPDGQTFVAADGS